ncbi:Gfo/Idh/MocA family protein [Limnoglobus roseus]|uniref:Putative Rossmann-fold-type glycoside hydrolase n=1 Tax=Limnoglobus roseus TaxID=2598579 RepID=A0A5C1A7J7_9BACT|nr:Gfo/Idh/MocA family oxidoreductase [Limnoglobus roseus]QEL14445.1 putative Rossmann-fold-type glycoside hydrolase [Limnoglobus roseus]
MSHLHPTRRQALATAALLPAWLTASAREEEKPKIALIGCGGRGRGIVNEAAKFGNVVALCDVDSQHAADAAKTFPKAEVYGDFRKVIDRKDVSIILNATPDHWHTFVNLAALKAGKDVYSEKPLTFTIDEGKRLVAAVKASGRVLQTGSQQRSDAKFRLACEVVRNNRLGKLTQITTILPAGPAKPAPKAEKPPATLNWEMWQGQAPERDYSPERCHLWFRFWREYSGGTITDWGAHHNDIALWALGLDRSGPQTIEGKILAKPIEGGYTTIPEYEIDYTYANGVKHRCHTTTTHNIFGQELRKPGPGETGIGVKFEGPDGWLFVTRGKIEASKPEILKDAFAATDVRLPVSDNHMGNFFDSVKSRKPPLCDAEIGHRTASLCHLGNIALRLGRKLTWDPAKEVFVNDKDADTHLAREQRKPWTYEGV